MTPPTMSVLPALHPSATQLPSGPATGLRCRECGATYPLAPEHVCVECFGPLEVDYDLDALRRVTRKSVAAGPPSMWRYVGLLPAGHDEATRVSLGAGMTRLHRADNLANAVAAHAAQANLASVVLIPADLEAGKVVSTAVYGGTLVAVDGTYDDVNRLCAEIAGELPWAFVNVNLRPYYAEGSKTLGYEVAEQLGWRLPAQVVVPMASGSLLTKVDKAFGEFGTLGLVEPSPYAVFGAQASGCAPISAAFRAGHDVVTPVRPATIAKSLAIGNPADGGYALDSVRRTGGAVADVPDEEIVAGIRLLASTEGIFAETAGGVTVATLRRLLDGGLLDPAAETVLLNTGDGLKTLDAVAPVVGPTATIAPSLEAFRKAGLA